MTARAIVWDGSFGDTSLPKISLGFAPTLPGAIYDWAADSLPDGTLSTWPSAINGASLAADSGGPIVLSSGGGKAVRFNGTTDRMRLPFVLTSARTFVAVYRFTTVRGGASVTYGYLSTAGGAITTDGASTLIGGTIGSEFLIPGPHIAPDTNWHIAVLSVNGSNSAFRQDKVEVVGNAPLNNTDGLTLGFASGGNNRAPIEYKRVAVLAGGTTGAQRDSIVNQLAARYNITL